MEGENKQKQHLAIMVDAESMEESVEDMTAAETAPRPKKATAGGVMYCRARGRITWIREDSTLF